MKTNIDLNKPSPHEYALFRDNGSPKSQINSGRKIIQAKTTNAKKRNKTTTKTKKNMSLANNNHHLTFQKESNYLNVNAEGEVVEVEEMEQNSLSAFNREPGTPLTSANTGDGLNLSNNPSTR